MEVVLMMQKQIKERNLEFSDYFKKELQIHEELVHITIELNKNIKA